MAQLLRSRSLFLAAGLGLGLLAGCEDGAGGIGRANAQLTAPDVDFGVVQVGIAATYDLEITNMGSVGVKVTGTDLAATFSGPEYVFAISEKELAIPPQGKYTVQLSFQPLVAMDEPVESELTFHTDVKAPDGSSSLTVKVRGRGIESGLLVEPSPIEFGAVLIGTSRTLDVKITNLLTSPVDLKTEVGVDQKAKITTSGGNGRFELENLPGADGSLLPSGTQLQPDDSVTLQLTYTPDAIDANRPDFGRWVIRNCDNSLCELEVRMSGHGTASGIECQPVAVEFGAINPGRMALRTVTCTNISTGDVTVASWGIAPASPAEFSASAAPSAPVVVAMGESFNIEVYFRPTQATLGLRPMGALVVQSQSDGRNLDPVTIPLTGEGGGPAIEILPDRLDFGRIAVGTTHSKRLVVQNSGYSELVVSSIATDGAEADLFFADMSGFSLATGTSTVVTVTFAPDAELQAAAELVFLSNDGSTPEVRVPLSGVGVALPPCDYTLQPTNVTFGVVPIRQTLNRVVRIINNGASDCLVNDVALTGDPAFTLTAGNETGIVIAGGASKDISVDYTPPVAATHESALGFYISNPSASSPVVPLHGVGLAQTEIQCPPPVTTPAGTPVILTLNATTQGTIITSYDWTITNAPAGGIGTPQQWTPDPPRAQTVTFLPYIVGVYDLHVTVTDNAMNTLSCDTQVTAEGHGLRVQLTWDGSGDLDLHLHNGNMTPWFGSTDDCYYANRTPAWNPAQPVATAENPELDFDNTFGSGPENTRVDTVVVGQAYTIAVHNYSGGSGRTATLDVFCGGVTSPTQTFTSPILAGSTSGQCSANDFWKVATVVFSSQTSCTVTPINTIVQSSAACTAF